MSDLLPTALGIALKSSAVLLVVNEIRGLILAIPVLYGLYQSGGTAMAIWLAVSSLGGIALTVVVPLIANRKIRHFLRRRRQAGEASNPTTDVAYGGAAW
jgi:hypothetical protein